MDKLLLCAFNMWRARQPSEQMNVTIVTDDPIRFDGRNCQHILNRWDWVTVGCYYAIGNGEVDIPNIAGIHSEKSCVLAAVADPELLATLSDQCNQHGVRIFAPTYAPVNTLDNDMIREVAHFDYEFGAKNEWDGAPAQFPIPTLQLLSAASCRGYYPAWAFDQLPRRDDRWKVMDIGCGPISVLRWGAIRGLLSITGVDPLLPMYDLIRARHGYNELPAIRCEYEFADFAENLPGLVPDGAFDLIYTQNALDHTRDPFRVVNCIASKLTTQGRAVFQVATREGSRQNWDQFHKTDIDLIDGKLVYRHQDTPFLPLISPDSGLRLARVHVHTPDWLAVVLERA